MRIILVCCLSAEVGVHSEEKILYFYRSDRMPVGPGTWRRIVPTVGQGTRNYICGSSLQAPTRAAATMAADSVWGAPPVLENAEFWAAPSPALAAQPSAKGKGRGKTKSAQPTYSESDSVFHAAGGSEQQGKSKSSSASSDRTKDGKGKGRKHGGKKNNGSYNYKGGDRGDKEHAYKGAPPRSRGGGGGTGSAAAAGGPSGNSTSTSTTASTSRRQHNHNATGGVELISMDVDGTVADISRRIALAEGKGKKGSSNYWETLLDGQHYHMDEPIVWCRDFLRHWAGMPPFAATNAGDARTNTAGEQEDPDLAAAVVPPNEAAGSASTPTSSSSTTATTTSATLSNGDQPPRRAVIYVSGRRTGTEGQTRDWLAQHGFPLGEIRHRPQGVRSMLWKRDVLSELRQKGGSGPREQRQRLIAHVGDRDDDTEAAARAGVRGIFVHPDRWLTKQEAVAMGVADLVNVYRPEEGQTNGGANHLPVAMDTS